MRAMRSGIGIVLALVAAAAAGLYLWRAQRAVERVLAPVDVPAPVLFPADTLCLAVVNGLDQRLADVEGWWRRFEGTATWHLLSRHWREHRDDFPAPMRAALAMLDDELGKAEAKFGARPTTREFFETYARHTAVGLVPGVDGPPHLLAVLRLPEGPAAAALRSHLAAAGDVRPGEPAERHGFPVFREVRDGADVLHYGVGGGYLFVADDSAPLGAALDRLATAMGPTLLAGAPIPTLADDPALRAVLPGPWTAPAVALYVRRAQAFARFDPDLALLDEYVQNAFVLAPDAPAVAFGMQTGADGTFAVRSSFPHPPPRDWARALPAGLASVTVTLPVAAAEARAAGQPALDRLLAKPLWSELTALVKDGARLRRLAEEALPPHLRPDETTVSRLPADLALLGDAGRAWLTAVLGEGPTALVMASKVYDLPATVTSEGAFGLTLDPLTVFSIAGALDLAQRRFPDWIQRDAQAGALVWRLHPDKVSELTSGPVGRARPAPLAALERLAPAILLAGPHAFLIQGEHLLQEMVALHGGGNVPTLADDPLWLEALAAVPAGYWTLDYQRPEPTARFWRAAGEAMITSALDAAAADPAISEAWRGLLGAADAAMSWVAATRATLTAGYPAEARPAVRVVLRDAAAESAVPAIGLPAAPLLAPALLPVGTHTLAVTRVDLRAAAERLRAAFAAALPGGEARLQQWAGESLDAAVVGDCWRDVLANVTGEMGVAIACPPVPPQAGTIQRAADAIVRIPSVIAFAQFREPPRAFNALLTAAQRLAEAVNPPAFDARLAAFQEGHGPPPGGVRVTAGRVGAHPAFAVDWYIPVDPRTGVLSLSACVLARDDFLLVTNGVATFQAMAAIGPDGAGTLAARFAHELPLVVRPGALSELMYVRTDGWVEQVGLYAHGLAPHLVMLSLGAYTERPPEARVAAHREGWQRALDLVLDVFRTERASLDFTTRTGDIIRTESRVVRTNK